FTAFHPDFGIDLWKSNGTETGTVLVKNIVPGPGSPYVRDLVRDLTEVNGTLFFTAFRPDTGTELWTSDGTEQGTVLVKDISPGTGSSGPSNLTNVNGTLFFSAC